MICVVKNPYDVILETADAKNLFNCQNRMTITDQLSNKEFPEWWDKWVSIQSDNMIECHRYIVNKAVDRIPTYFVRYEDLVRDPAPVLLDIFRVILNVESLQDTLLERRISDVAARFKHPTSKNTQELYSMGQIEIVCKTLREY